MLTIGLGQSEGIDTTAVTQKTLAACRSQMGDHTAQAGIVLAGVQFDHSRMLALINDAFPGIQLIGCTTAGDFSTALGFSDDAITLMVFHSDDIQFGTGVGSGLSGEYETAVRNAVRTARGNISQAPALCLTFPQGYNIQYEPVLKKLTAELGKNCPIFGGAAGTDWTDEIEILQFFGRDVLTDAIPLLLMCGPLEHAFSIANSWRPLGKQTVVTGSEGPRVQKIGRRRAVDFYRHYLGHHEEPAREFILAVYEQGHDEFYMRAPVQYHLDGSVTFSATIPQGARVQLAEATREDLIQDTLATAQRLGEKTLDWHPAVALAFSCAFRKEILGTEAQKELDILKEAFPAGLPIVGFYSFGEIAPLVPGGESLAHGATLVTLLVGAKSVPRHRTIEAGIDEPLGPEDENRQHRIAFLEQKLQRSQSYRQRLEARKDFNSRMHRRIMTEIDEARQKIQQKEAALRKSEEKFRRIVQTTGEAFILMDESLTVIDANDAYCRLVGYPRSDLLGRSNVDLAAPEFRQFLVTNREELLAKEYRKFEGTLVARDGSQIPILVHGNTLRDDRGAVIGHMAFITDLTEQKKALALAGEVQRNLLPQESPQVPGLDVAGRNVSCDEVGGDYYDFFWRRKAPETPFSVAVGDITGHGVDAALLMTSARAFLRLHASGDEPLSQIIGATNRHLAKDVLESGRFMTLFYLTVSPDLNSVEWVRAGHEPAIVYDPSTKRFEDLKGPGIALGIDDQFSYQPNRKTGLTDGQVIAIGTDGIWESCNLTGEMFGRERFKEVLRKNAHASARHILDAIFANIDDFSQGKKSDDDITLVIIKIKKKSG